MPGIFKESKKYNHAQVTPAATWTIVHNMGGLCAVDAYLNINGEDQKVIPAEINYVDSNTMEVVFSSAQSGYAVVIL